MLIRHALRLHKDEGIFIFILLENRQLSNAPHTGLLFSNPVEEVVCFEPEKLHHQLIYLDKLRRSGYYLAGCISYEAGYVLRGLSKLLTRLNFPLMHFFAFKSPAYCNAATIDAFLGSQKANISAITLDITKQQYEKAFLRIKAHIEAGDTYQVNFTTKYRFNFEGSSKGLYRLLRERQKVAFSALLQMPGYEVLSFSPELFFSKIKHKMFVKPMKGTMPRGVSIAEDKANQAFLKTDIKSRAENTMIVDLLRHDLATISNPGSVQVSKLLEVESLETVHQMTSSIDSDVPEDLSIGRIIEALFPCGSITGTPKRRTMEIIHNLESGPRAVYTGAIGYITPQNDMCFNVPIRTLLCHGQQGVLGVGGGIVHDSLLEAEFAEMQLKARFFTSALTEGAL